MELKRYWQILVKRWWTFFWIVTVIVGTVTIGSLVVTPIYSFSSYIQIRSTDPLLSLLNQTNVLPSELLSLGTISSDTVMEGQLRMIQNHTRLRSVIDQLGLEKIKGKPYPVQKFVNPGKVSLIGGSPGVIIKIPQSTQLLEVQGYSPQPAQAVEIANLVAQQFMESFTIMLQDGAKEIHAFILNQIPKAGRELEDIEKELYRARAVNHLGNLSYYREKLLTSFASLQDNLDSAEREQIEAQKKINQTLEKLKSIPEFRESTIAYEVNPRIDYLKKKIADYEADVAASDTRLTEEHPTMKQYQSRLKDLKNQLRSEVKETFMQRQQSRNSYYDTLLQNLGDAEINSAVLKARQSIYEQQLAERRSQLDDITNKEREMAPLERRVDVLKTTYANLLKSEQAVKLACDAPLSNAEIVEWANLPAEADLIKKYRWFPKRTKLVVIAAILSVFAGIGIILLQEYLDDSISDRKAAEAELEVPILAALPTLKDIPKPCAFPAIMDSGPWLEGIVQLEFMLLQNKVLPGVLGITSPGAGEGKSLVLASLGHLLSQEKYRVLLVDLNIPHPCLEELFQLPPRPGICDVLMRETHSHGECIYPVGQGGLSLIPVGSPDGAMLKYTGYRSLAGEFASLKSQYDVVLIDLPPMSNGGAPALVGLGGQSIIVVADRKTPKSALDNTLREIERYQGRIQGLVLNRTPAPATSLLKRKSV